MNKLNKTHLSVALILTAIALPIAAWAMEHPTATPAKPVSLDQLYHQQLPQLAQALESTQKAVEMGHKDHALMELKKAQTLLAALQTGLSQHIKPVFANTACPIMGSPIDPEKVPDSLIREYNGQKIGFCCAGCPSMWDKLTDEQKQAKLAKVKAPAK